MKIFKNISKYLYSLTLLMFLFQAKLSLAMMEQTDAFVESAGIDPDISDNTATDTIAAIIKIFLGFLGVIFIILVIYSGYNWMTAGGNEEKVTKARTTIFRAIIGIIITVSAYAITFFVFGALDNATTGP